MALDPVSPGISPAANYERLNAAIAEARKVAGKQDAFDLPGLLQSVSQVVARVAGAYEALDEISDALAPVLPLVDLLNRHRFDFTGPLFRPGDAPGGFVIAAQRSGLAGDGGAFPDISSDAITATENGRAVRLTGSGIIATRQAVPIEPARVYRVRYVVQRRVNPSDPSNDSVALGIVWLDGSLRALAPANDATIVEDIQDLTTAYGRQERQVAFSLSPSADAQFQAPRRARYARPFVQTYGLDGGTDIEVLGIDDVTLATVLAPETASTVQDVAALKSLEIGPRLSVLEQEAGSTNAAVFNTKADAAAADIPDSAKTVQVRGLVQPGDGGDGLYARISGAAPAGSDSFVNDGATFTRVFVTADILGALLRSLPTTLPVVPDRAWLDGGILAVS